MSEAKDSEKKKCEMFQSKQEMWKKMENYHLNGLSNSPNSKDWANDLLLSIQSRSKVSSEDWDK